MVNILVFANCHGAAYKDIIEKSTLPGSFEIEHVLSYENLDKHSALKDKFSQCDILIIQPIQNHEDFRMENVEPLLKRGCLVVKVPFVRFDGFWLPRDSREMAKFDGAAVVHFPNIRHEHEIPDYLSGAKLDSRLILDVFQLALDKLVALEKLGDIKFVDFFVEHYKQRPLFRDAWHPTKIFFQHIALQVADAVAMQYPHFTTPARPRLDLAWKKEYGHFKPIADRCAETLGLEYDLDSYFIYSRFDYLKTILRHENHGEGRILDLKQLKTLFATQ